MTAKFTENDLKVIVRAFLSSKKPDEQMSPGEGRTKLFSRYLFNLLEQPTKKGGGND